MQLSRLKAAWRSFAASSYGRWTRKLLRAAFLIGIVCYLIYQFTEIGWQDVWASLPTMPLFYVLLLCMYVTLPVAEAFLYGRTWGLSFWRMLPALLRKRVYNNEVMGYSGEFYFYWWAKQYTPVSVTRVRRTVKDNVLVSGITSMSTATLLLALFFLFDQIRILESYLPEATSTWIAAGGGLLALLSAGFALRRFIFSLAPSVLALFAGVHVARVILVNGFQVLQWMVVLPDVPMAAWLTLVSLFIVINRIPLLPGSDLVFMSAGVELSSWLGIPPAAVAGMLLVNSVIGKGLNLSIYMATSLRKEDVDGPVASRKAGREAVKL